MEALNLKWAGKNNRSEIGETCWDIYIQMVKPTLQERRGSNENNKSNYKLLKCKDLISWAELKTHMTTLLAENIQMIPVKKKSDDRKISIFPT